ncbi:MAG: hypothetical protein J0H83_03195 [Candidatus Melainabacteria bacterium]|nr:hypothetical protein [Candidatus Melainabacteria bacterium]
MSRSTMFSGIPVFALMALIAGSDAQIACAAPEHKIAPAALKLGIYSNTEADARKFAQTFYDWYIPDMTSNVPVPSSERMLTQRAGLIDPVLRGLLKDDLLAAQETPDEVVGLDFDPYVNSQETPSKLKVGTVTRKGPNYLVSMDASDAKGVVTPELAYRNNSFVFVDFYYDYGKKDKQDNLLNILRTLRKQRQTK